MHSFDLIKAGMHRCAEKHSLKVVFLGLGSKAHSLEYRCSFLFHLKIDLLLKVAHKSVRLTALELQIPSSHKARVVQARKL